MKFTFWASIVCGILFLGFSFTGQISKNEAMGAFYAMVSTIFMFLGIILLSIFLVGRDIVKKIEEKSRATEPDAES